MVQQLSNNSQWFSSLLNEAKDEARTKGNTKYVRYLEDLLRSSNVVVGGGAE